MRAIWGNDMRGTFEKVPLKLPPKLFVQKDNFANTEARGPLAPLAPSGSSAHQSM